MSQDVEATLRCLTALGGRWRQTAPGTLEITGIGGRRECSCSGPAPSGLRRIRLHFALLSSHRAGSGQRRRLYRSGPPDGPAPGPYLDLFREKGIFYEQTDGALTVRGTLTPGEYHLPGNVSSQFFTGLLFALPLLDGPSTIVPTTAVESWDYILMTLDALTGAGRDRRGAPDSGRSVSGLPLCLPAL